jgi:hypothetical protein
MSAFGLGINIFSQTMKAIGQAMKICCDAMSVFIKTMLIVTEA